MLEEATQADSACPRTCELEQLAQVASANDLGYLDEAGAEAAWRREAQSQLARLGYRRLDVEQLA